MAASWKWSRRRPRKWTCSASCLMRWTNNREHGQGSYGPTGELKGANHEHHATDGIPPPGLPPRPQADPAAVQKLRRPADWTSCGVPRGAYRPHGRGSPLPRPGAVLEFPANGDVGITSPKQLNLARHTAVESGWLAYHRNGTRDVGEYWTTTPPDVAGFDADKPIEEAPPILSPGGTNQDVILSPGNLNQPTILSPLGMDCGTNSGMNCGKLSIPSSNPIPNTVASVEKTQQGLHPRV